MIHVAIVRDQPASYDEGSPMELDTSTATEFAFAMAGIDLDTNSLSNLCSHSIFNH